ncbi:Lrp/AsnC family transcriptional regulator [Pseudomaricurvus sp.]|uniref:Lrp/AsnC family transcriptional regulator n=1 Tax=Pseudomaricurvus sp. TaxID=2004510 RepID=UPI003F6C2C1C
MSDAHQLDDFDMKILKALQENADYSMNELGDLVGLSHTPCWRRIKRLEAEGFIKGKVTLLDASRLNLSVTVHASVIVKEHNSEALEAFEASVHTVKEIVECYSTTGEKDYLLRVVVNSVEHYEKLLKHTLLHLPNVASVHSTFALKAVKYTTALPLDSAAQR